FGAMPGARMGRILGVSRNMLDGPKPVAYRQTRHCDRLTACGRNDSVPREGVRLDVLRRLQLPASPPSLLLPAAWKYGVAVGVAAVVLTAGGVDRAQPNGHVLATSVLPTTVPCGTIATDPNDP